uniref:Uncharacterized protein n=1 Tax=viral metagenome TaxID=1070528 RepID=A0A6C0ADR9_9ZZZZ
MNNKIDEERYNYYVSKHGFPEENTSETELKYLQLLD